MGQVIALIPARAGSKGIPGKNFREVGGIPLFEHAVRCALAAGIHLPCVSTNSSEWEWEGTELENAVGWIRRPTDLAQDDTPMIAVVQHALAQIPGDPDDLLVLLQPTAPLRTPAHVRAAIALLRETQADSVVSVVPVPLTHSPDLVCYLWAERLEPWEHDMGWAHRPARRQDVTPAYRPDGTVYACWRRTVTDHGTIYGRDCRPLLIDPAESCELDSEADWDALVARWALRSA